VIEWPVRRKRRLHSGPRLCLPAELWGLRYLTSTTGIDACAAAFTATELRGTSAKEFPILSDRAGRAHL
jgi:hypothetical protein